MKKLTLLLLCLVPVGVFAQFESVDKTQPYLFEEFDNAVVKMKTGDYNKALMNYNTVTEEMIFNQNDKMLALDKLETVDTVYLNNRVFVPVGKVFYEYACKGPIPLYIQHKNTLVPAGKPAAYGGTTQTSSVTSLSSLSGNGNIYKLKLPEEYETSNATLYWIRKDNKWEHFLNGSQLRGLLPERKEDIKNFVKEKRTDFKKIDDVVMLMRYLNAK